MPGKDGKKFLCFLPKVEKIKTEKPISQQNTSSVIVGTEKRLKPKTPDELLEVLKDRCFIRVRINLKLVFASVLKKIIRIAKISATDKINIFESKMILMHYVFLINLFCCSKRGGGHMNFVIKRSCGRYI